MKKRPKMKRIEVTVEIDIPDYWTIGDTEESVVKSLHSGGFKNVEVGMQRSTKPRRIYSE